MLSLVTRITLLIFFAHYRKIAIFEEYNLKINAYEITQVKRFLTYPFPPIPMSKWEITPGKQHKKR